MSSPPVLPPFEVSVQGWPRNGEAWRALARRVEQAGLRALLVADHPGGSAAPFVALATAAAVTERIRLGTYVVNAGVWHPLTLAGEVATLDHLSDGRAELGIGAGHLPGEWTAVGRPFPPARARVGRMIEVAEATRALLAGGPVTARGDHVVLDRAALDAPRPVQEAIPLLVGGNGDRLLDYAARAADVVGITGLVATVDRGHGHLVDWTDRRLARILDIVRGGGDGRRPPSVDVLVQHVEVTDHARRRADRLADQVRGATADDLLTSPFVWIGTVEEIRARLESHRARWGLHRYTVRDHTLDDVARILAAPSPVPR